MTKVFAQASVSLDGYIAGPGGTGFDRLFAWCTAGDVETPTRQPDRLTYRTNSATAAYLRELIDETGAIVVGRRLFDVTNGWGGSHPSGVPVFVVTHQPPADWSNTDTPFSFVTDGVAAAIEKAKAVAGGKKVGIGPGSTVGQALRAGLVDELRVDLVPVTLGGGVRMLDGLDDQPRDFATPRVIAGIGVTHLIYQLS
ncbi:dihydrofolate reductase family protein [Kribbella sp. CA-294648]|uniref:dihydrofolate reductase family protein n=1 Tax=Kribbella sp. CA-294648 TaxID=3239948 RepID=UPI003D9432EB